MWTKYQGYKPYFSIFTFSAFLSMALKKLKIQPGKLIVFNMYWYLS